MDTLASSNLQLVDVLIVGALLLALSYFIFKRIREKRTETFEKRDN